MASAPFEVMTTSAEYSLSSAAGVPEGCARAVAASSVVASSVAARERGRNTAKVCLLWVGALRSSRGPREVHVTQAPTGAKQEPSGPAPAAACRAVLPGAHGDPARAGRWTAPGGGRRRGPGDEFR